MKKKYAIIIILTLIATLGIESFFILKKNKKPLQDDEIFATYKGGVIYVKDMRNYLKRLEDTFNQKLELDSLKPEEKKLIVDEIVNGRVILELAKNSNIPKSEEYKNKLKDTEDLLLKEMFLQSLIKKNVTEEAIKNKYEEVKKLVEGKKEYKVKQIVVKTKEDIQKVVKELKTKSFEEVAGKYSVDAGKDNGGNLGYILEGQTIPEFEEVLKKQPLNKLSEPFETKMGWHVLIKEDERPATVPDFEKTKDVIKVSLTTEFIKKYSLDNLKDKNIELKK